MSAGATGEAPEADARQDRTETAVADLRDQMGTAVDARQGQTVTGEADLHGRATIGADVPETGRRSRRQAAKDG